MSDGMGREFTYLSSHATNRYFIQMFYDERKRVQERYKEYDGTYLGHYVQYFFWFFCVIGIVIFGLTIFLLLDSHYHWSK